MRTMHSPISATTGCKPSTARGTFTRPSAMTTSAATVPASAQASVSRFTSPKPEKRHMLCGTRASASATR